MSHPETSASQHIALPALTARLLRQLSFKRQAARTLFLRLLNCHEYLCGVLHPSRVCRGAHGNRESLGAWWATASSASSRQDCNHSHQNAEYRQTAPPPSEPCRQGYPEEGNRPAQCVQSLCRFLKKRLGRQTRREGCRTNGECRSRISWRHGRW